MIAKFLALLPLLERLASLVPALERRFGGGTAAQGDAAQMRELEQGIANFLEELTVSAREQRREVLELRARTEALIQQTRVVAEHAQALEAEMAMMAQQLRVLWLVAIGSAAGIIALVVMVAVLLTRR